VTTRDGTTGRRAEIADPANPPFSFSDIAPRYDALNRLMSLGCDRRWRAIAARAVKMPAGGSVLDVGTGTGDMALALVHQHDGATIVAVDSSTVMLRVGREKREATKIRWARGDGLRLPFPDEYFDAVTSAFLLRNVTDVPAILAEQRRVVRPGGRVVCLEMTWPRTPGFRELYQLYFARLAPSIVGKLSGQPAAYRYLPLSVQEFMSPEELGVTMEQAGLQNVHHRMLMLGTVALHVGERGEG
jgi:demethylmenaquinone methyltransferase/2-methoxy-6-polyprenyl-1,4-benzoquinol methylase